MTSKLYALKDVASGEVEHVDLSTGKVYQDSEGLRFTRQMHQTEQIVTGDGKVMRDPSGRIIPVTTLSDLAAQHYWSNVATVTGRTVQCDMHDESGQLVKMDLAPADVHTNATLANYAAGYRIADGVADIASPVVMVPKQSNVYYTWDKEADFQRKLPNAASPGGQVSEVNPTLSNATYLTNEYALGGFLPTEVQSNADAPLQPFQKLMQVVVDALRLEREYRVQKLLSTSGNWGSGQVITIAAGSQWDGGASSDPVLNLHNALENSFLPVTGIVWSELVEHDFIRNPAVQKYFTYKDMIDGYPDPSKISSTLKLPPIYTARMKYLSAASTLSYIWGNNVILLHQPPQQPPTSQMDVATSYSFRWNGGTAPDGAITAGFLVRSYFDPKRGGRGGTAVVVAHNDVELMTSKYVGGLLLNAHQ